MPTWFTRMTDKQEKEYKKKREERLKKLGIKVAEKKKSGSLNQETWKLDKSGYKRKEGMFRKEYKPVKYAGQLRKAKVKRKATKRPKRTVKRKRTTGSFWDKLRSL